MTQREYEQEIRDLAELVRKEAEERGEDIHDVLHETIDGHQWVIYTHYNRLVLTRTDNPDACTEEFGRDMVADAAGNVDWAALAYAAMLVDVREELDR